MYHHFVLEETSLQKKAESVPETSYKLFQYIEWEKSRKSVSLNGTEELLAGRSSALPHETTSIE